MSKNKKKENIVTFERAETERRFTIEREILHEIKQSQHNPEGMTDSSFEELERERRRTVLSIWALRNQLHETAAA